jgi:predicted RNA-binding protein with RPS1 domain
VGDEVDVTYVRGNDEHTTKVTLGSDEALQAQQEEERKQQEEAQQQYMQQYEEFMRQFQQQYSWPWDSYGNNGLNF